LYAPAVGAACRVVALRFWLYSQLEYVTAAMLSNHVPRGEKQREAAAHTHGW
jgi:hypothetical protein